MIESSDPAEGLQTLFNPTAQNSNVPVPSHLKLHLDADSESLEFERVSHGEPPAKQVEQLALHLKTRQKDLAQREANLQAQSYHWEKQVLSSKAHLRKRSAELEQHLSQVRLQQAQLIKLQQNLIDSQVALRVIVERIVNHVGPGELKAELASLQVELGERIDVILNRWEKLSLGLQTK
jgi:chromosome segregation ATPase